MNSIKPAPDHSRILLAMITIYWCIISPITCVGHFIIDNTRLSIDKLSSINMTSQTLTNPLPGGKISVIRVEDAQYFNPFTTSRHVSTNWQLCYTSLMTPSVDNYGLFLPLIASNLSLSTDKKRVDISINPSASFINQIPITSDDVIASMTYFIENDIKYDHLRTAGLIFQKISDQQFSIISQTPISLEKVITLGLLPVTSAGTIKSDHPIESGAYQLTKFKKNQIAILKKRPFWGENLASQTGLYQFDTINLIYMKSRLSSYQAFKRHDADYHWEPFQEEWASLKRLALKNKALKLKQIEQKRAQGMTGFAFNQHKPYMKNSEVRKAFNLAFDYHFINQSLLGQNTHRILSYFTNTPYQNHKNTPPGFNLDEADQLLIKNNWITINTKRVHKDTKKPLHVRILVDGHANEKIANIYKKNLESLGITCHIQKTNQADYLYQLQEGQFDIAYFNIPIAQLSPDTIISMFSHNSGQSQDFASVLGVHNSNLEEKIIDINKQANMDDKIKAIQNLDQFLYDQYLFIPFWHPNTINIAHWDNIDGPSTSMEIRPSNYFYYWWATDQSKTN